MESIYFYVFSNKSLDIYSCQKVGEKKYLLSNGRYRNRNEDVHPLDCVYGNSKEIIMYSNSDDKTDFFVNEGIMYIKKQIEEKKEKYNFYNKYDNEKIMSDQEDKICKFNLLLKELLDYKEEKK